MEKEYEKFVKFLKEKYTHAHLDFKKNRDEVIKNHLLTLQSSFYNQYHIHPFSGLINDPNNLAFFNKKFHIFYQWSPYAAIHVNKHQGYYSTKDFIHFENHFIGIAPDTKEDRDGIYSGGALIDNNKYYLFWTGNVKKDNVDNSLINTSYTLVAELKNNKLSKKKVLFQVDHSRYTRNFRDPKVFKINGKYYLIQAAQKHDLKPVLVVYSSKYPNKNYTFEGEINFVGQDSLDWGYMLECPDYFKIGKKDILIFSTQGKNYFGKQNQNNDNSLFCIGQMNWESLTFKIQKIQNIDLGFDFYAPQMFANTKKPMMLAWGSVPEADNLATIDNKLAFNLTLPRELTIKQNHIYQKPLKALEKLRIGKAQKIKSLIDLENRAKEFNLIIDKHFSFSIFNKKQKITFKYRNNVLTVNRSNMAFVQTDKNGSIWTREIKYIKNIQLFLDNSYIEIFINDGENVFSTIYWIDGKAKIKFSKSIKGIFYNLSRITFNPSFDNKVVLLPGEALIDQFKDNSKSSVIQKVGGAPLNVAVAIKKWNFNPLFMGTIGNDNEAKLIKKHFKEFNLDSKYLKETKIPTTIANVELDKEGERQFTFKRGADQEFNVKFNKDYDALVLSSATAFLGGALLKSYKQYLTQAYKKNKLIIFDPNYREALYKNKIKEWKKRVFEFIEKSTIIKLSEEELMILIDNGSKEEKVKKILNLGVKLVLITMGKKGTYCATKKETMVIPSIKVKQIDSTGAGDAFLGTFIAQIINLDINWNKFKIEEIENVIKRANIAAALSTETLGGAESIPSLKVQDKRWEKENEFKK